MNLPLEPQPRQRPYSARHQLRLDVETHASWRNWRPWAQYAGNPPPEEQGVEPFGKEAKEANRRCVEGQTVQLELDAEKYDKYRPLLAYIYVGDARRNAEPVRQEYVQVATYPPNVIYQELFL